MPAMKCDIYVTVSAHGKSVSLGGVRLPDGRYKIKRGRSWATRKQTATLSEIFTEARKWAVRNG